MGEVPGGATPSFLQQSPIFAPTRVDMLAEDSAAMHVEGMLDGGDGLL